MNPTIFQLNQAHRLENLFLTVPKCTTSLSLSYRSPPTPPCQHSLCNQEWEAYVSDSDSEGEGRDSWSDMLSPEERERQRREREESRRVLSELKAVLGFRASEEERMKRKQLLFNEQGLQ